MSDGTTDDATDDAKATEAAKALVAERQWPVTIKLGTPVEFGKETITELVFQRGNFGVLKGLALDISRTPNIDEIAVIASRLCGKSLKVIELLDPSDVDEVAAIAIGFFGRCRGAGKKL